MSWLLFSITMFICSNILYVLIRLAQKSGIGTSVYSTVNFCIQAVFYFGLILLTGSSFILPVSHLAMIIAVAVVWGYLGNYFSQKGILYAPNPGYSLMIQKSYGVITTLLAVALFGLTINPTKFLGILLIIIFVGVISYGNPSKDSEPKWVLFSLLAHVIFAFGSLISKQFLNMGLEPFQYLFYIKIVTILLNIGETKFEKLSFAIERKHYLLMFGIGLAGMAVNMTMQYAYKFAPNPGYVVGFNTASIMSVTILSWLLFKDQLSKLKVLGIFGVLVGLVTLAFG